RQLHRPLPATTHRRRELLMSANEPAAIAAAPTDGASAEAPLLAVENRKVGFGPRGQVNEVVHGISFTVESGRCLAIVGESGSGKTVTARTLVGLTGGRSQVDAGRMELNGSSLIGLSDRRWRAVRGAEVGFVLQDALVSLDPLRKVGKE